MGLKSIFVRGLARGLILGLVPGALAGAAAQFAAAQATVKVEPASVDGPRPLADQTAQAVVRDYLESWQGLDAAMDQNRADLLDADFVGGAKDKLAQAIRDQEQAGIHTRYQDRSHDVQIVFYSPEGLSIELTDTVEYDVQLMDHDKAQGTQHVRAHYVVVLTPSESRWRVRVLQSDAE
jgi:hypothetical protein